MIKNFGSSYYSSSASKSVDVGLREYMLNVYNMMCVALMISAMSAFAVINFEPLFYAMFNVTPMGMHYTGLGYLVCFSPLAIVFAMSFGFASMQLSTLKMLFWLYSTLVGMSISASIYAVGPMVATKTFFVTASAFGAMSIYGHVTKRDLSFMPMMLLGLLVVSVINIFLRSPMMHFLISAGGVVIFMGLTAYDTQKLKDMYYSYGSSNDVSKKLAVMGAFSLYLDFINLFMYLLRFFAMSGRRND